MGPRASLDGFGQEKTLLPLSGFEPTNRPAGNLVITLAGLEQLTSNTFMIKITNYALTSKVMWVKKKIFSCSNVVTNLDTTRINLYRITRCHISEDGSITLTAVRNSNRTHLRVKSQYSLGGICGK